MNPRIAAILLFLSLVTQLSAKECTDTLFTKDCDMIIVRYSIYNNDDAVTLRFNSRPRIIPAKNSALNEKSKGDLEKLWVMAFDRVGDYGETKLKGLVPKAFMTPAGMKHANSEDGFYILGQSQDIVFEKCGTDKADIKIPLFVAQYEKKRNYKILASGIKPLNISIKNQRQATTGGNSGTTTQRIAVESSIEVEDDNTDITSALSSIDMVRQLLSLETEIPFSQALQMEIINLNSLKNKISDPEVIQKINEVILECNERERQLKDAQNAADLSARAEQQAALAQQKLEDEARVREAEEKEKEKEEKQQKRTIWMIIGGVALAVLGFIGNTISKHIQDIRNKKSVIEMQDSLVRQAEHESRRRAREIVRNKAHQAMNKGRNEMRKKMQKAPDKAKSNERQQSGDKKSNGGNRNQVRSI